MNNVIQLFKDQKTEVSAEVRGYDALLMFVSAFFGFAVAITMFDQIQTLAGYALMYITMGSFFMVALIRHKTEKIQSGDQEEPYEYRHYQALSMLMVAGMAVWFLTLTYHFML